jgi:outer membrane receptor protein involved in Fe transport
MTGATPKWKALVSQSWENGKLGLSLTERWISAGVLSNEYIECQTNCPLPTAAHPTIYDNHVPSTTYVDLGATYTLSKDSMFYFKIDNLLDRDPVLIPQTNSSLALNPAVYDAIGRTYRAGLRMSFN